MGLSGLPLPAEPRAAAWRAGLAWLRPKAWLIFLTAGLEMALGAALAGDERGVQPLLTGLGFATTVAILVGVRMHRPARPLPWQLVALCALLTTIGFGFFPRFGEASTVGQALTAAGYMAGLGGFVLLVRGRIPGGDRGALLDAAILAAGTGILVWAFGFGPYVIAGRQSGVVTSLYFYPALVASAMVARMWFLDGAHRPATRLIVLLVLTSNGITIIDMLRAVIGQPVFPVPYLLAQFGSLAFVGAAALHPSMAIAPERHRAGFEPVGRRRIVALAAALLVNPATLAIEITSGHQVDPAPYLIGGTIIGLLVIARLGDALRQLGDSLRERESLMERLRRQALYDALTSLPNRTLFTERLAAAYEKGPADRMLAVLLLDIDDFKAVNDSYGHDAGDALLVAVGQRLRHMIRDGDTAARLGGDEFVVALSGFADPAIPVRVAQRILETLSQPFDFDGHSLTMGASIGVAVAGADDGTADDLVRNADIAMYLAKSRGKGRFEVFESSMQATATTQLQLRTDLAVAIAEGDLRLQYQPVIELSTGHAIGYEALVRWQRDGRLIPPGEFIPIAESSGSIGPLTDWVVDQACRMMASWGVAGDRPWVSVNLSSSQLVRPDAVVRLRRALEANELAPDRLVIEITESALLDIEIARPAVERLSEIGVRIAIDDFGIGYSALSYLARLPIDIVKIDRTFVNALHQAGPEEAIAAAIIALARRLDLTTIGEGIETVAQLEQLAELGCDLGQGFYLGRPVAVEDLPRTTALHDHRPRLIALPASSGPDRRLAARSRMGEPDPALLPLAGDVRRAVRRRGAS